MAVEWSEQYKTGDAALDATRKQLFDLTNSFLASDDLMVLRPIIVAMCKQMRAHFDLEETLMRDSPCARGRCRLGRTAGGKRDLNLTPSRVFGLCQCPTRPGLTPIATWMRLNLPTVSRLNVP